MVHGIHKFAFWKGWYNLTIFSNFFNRDSTLDCSLCFSIGQWFIALHYIEGSVNILKHKKISLVLPIKRWNVTLTNRTALVIKGVCLFCILVTGFYSPEPFSHRNHGTELAASMLHSLLGLKKAPKLLPWHGQLQPDIQTLRYNPINSQNCQLTFLLVVFSSCLHNMCPENSYCYEKHPFLTACPYKLDLNAVYFSATVFTSTKEKGF